MPKKNATKENLSAFKHHFGKSLLKRLSDAIGDVYPAFNRKHFLSLMPRLEPLEMKSRVWLLRDELKILLPEKYPDALRVLLQSTRKGELEGFDLWPYTEFIQTFGLDDTERSLNALKELTVLFTAEFAIRPFLRNRPEQTLQFLEKCAKDKSVDLRRWASEGSRPRLPWGERLQEFVKNPSATARILDELKFDPELYVRKSVSNHLNDIAKDHPPYVIALLKKWKSAAGPEHEKKIEWIIRRSLRTLIKEGHEGALKLIGVSKDAQIRVGDFKLNRKKFKLGERLDFEFTLQSLSAKPQNIVVDYIVHYVKSNQRTSAKVFKLKKMMLPPRGEAKVLKSHHLKKVTTREHYPGIHFLEIQINGVILQRLKWELSLK